MKEGKVNSSLVKNGEVKGSRVKEGKVKDGLVKKNKIAKILLVHPETRSYRVKLFSLLSENYDITFAFTWGEDWSSRYKESKRWKYKNFRRMKFIGYDTISPGIIWEFFRGYDVIISSGVASFSTHVGFLIAKLTGKKFITWDETWDWPKTIWAKIAKPYVKFIVKHSDACVAAGTKAKELYEKWGAKNVFIAPNSALDFSGKKVNPELKKKYKGKKIILYLSRIVEYKALDYLIKAFVKAKDGKRMDGKRIGDNVILLIGGDGDFRKHCESIAGSRKDIVFLGRIEHDKVYEYYDLCDVFVLPSRHLYSKHECSEAWGLVLNEVMSLGKPVLSTTAVAAAYDLIKKGVNGYQVKAGSVDELADGLARIMNSNLEKMGQESKKIIKKFTPKEQFKGFKKAIDFVLGK